MMDDIQRTLIEEQQAKVRRIISIFTGIVGLLLFIIANFLISNITPWQNVAEKIGITFFASGFLTIWLEYLNQTKYGQINQLLRSGIVKIYKDRNEMSNDVDAMFQQTNNEIRILCITFKHYHIDRGSVVENALKNGTKMRFLIPDYSNNEMKNMLRLFENKFKQGNIIEQVKELETWLNELQLKYSGLLEYHKYKEIPIAHLYLFDNQVFSSPFRPYMTPRNYTSGICYNKKRNNDDMYTYYSNYFNEIYKP